MLYSISVMRRTGSSSEIVVQSIEGSARHASDTAEVLSQCIYEGFRPERRAAAVAIYDSPSSQLIGAWKNGTLVGIVGLLPRADHTQIRHIAVRNGYRREGIGKRLIQHACSLCEGSQLTAETDKDAVGFYRKCGFSVESLGEKYPGTERFKCTLKT